MPADNKRFGEIGVKVIVQTSVRPLTVGDNPNGVQSNPNFVKPPGRCRQCGQERGGKEGCDFNMMLFQNKYLSLQRILIL